jgi:hypothetical protein
MCCLDSSVVVCCCENYGKLVLLMFCVVVKRCSHSVLLSFSLCVTAMLPTLSRNCVSLHVSSGVLCSYSRRRLQCDTQSTYLCSVLKLRTSLAAAGVAVA